MFIMLVLATASQHEGTFTKNVEEAFAFATGGFAARFAGAEVHLVLFAAVAADAAVLGADDGAVVAAATATPDTGEDGPRALLELNFGGKNGES